MSGGPPLALDLMAHLYGVAALVEVGELAVTHRAWSVDGPWSPRLASRDLTVLPRPLRHLFAPLVATRALGGVVVARGVAAGLLAVRGVGPWAWLALVTGLLVNMRWRGTQNGGSDHMMGVLAGALAVASVDPEALGPLALAYVAAQSMLSYLVAGVVKVREPMWRSGDALLRLAALPRYAVTPRARRLLSVWPRGAAWAVMLLECAAPLLLVSPRAAALMLPPLFLFHAWNAWALGINRFWWAWTASYPALWWAGHAVGG